MYLTRPKAAKYLGLTPKQFASIEYLLPHTPIKARHYYLASDLDDWREASRIMPGERAVVPTKPRKRQTGYIDLNKCGSGF
jgi:hypothetical protein